MKLFNAIKPLRLHVVKKFGAGDVHIYSPVPTPNPSTSTPPPKHKFRLPL